jgi:outer membrane lipoprotein-sorting protein
MGNRLGLVFGALVVSAAVAVGAASAQPAPPVPLPKNRPTMPPAAKPAAPTQQAAPVPLTPPASIIGQVPGRAGEATAFDSKQRALADKISVYLSSVQQLVGNFVQIGPDGSRLTGDFYIQKPGKVRFEYDAPSPIDIIADGTSVAVRDRKLATQDLYQLSQTPLRFLLSNNIDLLRDTNLIAVYADDVFATIVIEEMHVLVGTHRLMLMFGAKDLQLKQWTVTDPQGYDTTVAVYNLDTTKKPDPSMFKIDYNRYER